MKHFIYACAFTLAAIPAAAQLKVGANPTTISSGAILQADAVGTRGAFYLPRVALTGTADVTTVANPQAGFTLYNTATAGTAPADVTPGYYYHDGTKWIRLTSTSSSSTGGWDLTGNAGTNFSTHFLGTTDSKSLRIRTNNIERAIIDSLGNIGIGTVAPTASLQVHGGGVAGNDAVAKIFNNVAGGLTDVLALGIGNCGGACGQGEARSLVLYNANGSNGNFGSINFIPGISSTDVSGAAIYGTERNAGGAGTASLRFQTRATAAGSLTDRLTIRYDGTVGIGSSTPLQKLDVVGGTIIGLDRAPGSSLWSAAPNVLNLLSPTAITTNVVAAPETVLRLMRPGLTAQTWAPTADIQIGRYSTLSGSANTSINFKLSSNGTPTPEINVMSLLANGNVGVGTTTPNSTLDLGTSLSDQKFALWNSASGNDFYGIGVQSGLMKFTVSSLSGTGINMMTLTNAGRVGIGTTAPENLLHVASADFGAYNGVKIEDNTGANASSLTLTPGYLGNVASPTTATIDIVDAGGHGIIAFGDHIAPVLDNDAYCGTSALRWTAVYAANGTIQTSDMRMKENVENLNYGLKDIMKVNTITYDWKDHTNKMRKIGFNAQQLQTVMPELVNVGDDEKKTLGINYGDITPVLTKAIQDQQAQIETLKAQNEKLASESAAMAKQLAEIKELLQKK